MVTAAVPPLFVGKTRPLAILLALSAAPAAAQMQDMKGMQMPGMQQSHESASAKKAPAKKKPVKPTPARQGEPAPPTATPEQPAMAPMPGMAHDTPAQPSAPATPPPEMPAMAMPPPPEPGHGMLAMPGMAMPGGHGNMAHQMTGAFGSYPATREASGTAWQPDASEHGGIHIMSGDWMLMGHALLNGVYDSQGGPRGGDKTYLAGMVMGMAQRSFANGTTLQFRAMLSPDPLMGKSGYPLLLATGETADGVTPLVDRQHPHDLFMELSTSASFKIGETSLFLYGGLPGEPAFGPPAFMHRMSIMDSPEAPISHHWLDSTHITFGVVTAGVVLGNFKIEGSRFNGREPDQHRWDIETAPLDSTSARISWNPTRELSLQASWADLRHSEQLEPNENETRWSASAIYTRSLGEKRWWSTTAAWGRREQSDATLDALLLETALGLDQWTLFARAEHEQNNELVPALGHHGPIYEVGKVSIGAIRDFRIAPHLKFGIGGLFALNFIPDALESSYGGDPKGGMAFVRFKID